jgi:hypothetical protein
LLGIVPEGGDYVNETVPEVVIRGTMVSEGIVVK